MKGKDPHLKYLDEKGNTTRPDLGRVKKSSKLGHIEAVKGRYEQLEHASKELMLWNSMPFEVRLKRLKQLRAPVKWIPTAREDQIEVDELPVKYTRKARPRSYRSYGSSNTRQSRRTSHQSSHRHSSPAANSTTQISHRSSSLNAGPLTNFEEFNNDDLFESASEATGLLDTDRLLRDLVIDTPSVGSQSTVRPRIGTTPGSLSSGGIRSSSGPLLSSSSVIDELSVFDDTPELSLEMLQGFEMAMMGSPQPDLETECADLISMSSRYGRAVSIQLPPLVKFTSNAFLDKIRGGPIQQIQLFPRYHMAIVVFLFPSGAESKSTTTPFPLF